MSPASSLLSRPGTRRVEDRIEIRCRDCGYGAVVVHLPERCPMCAGTAWRGRALKYVYAELEQSPAVTTGIERSTG
jgi:predicted Zn-ribbon and HTH transcriptional regulator